jgi:Tfp pilus assembly protein PilF
MRTNYTIHFVILLSLITLAYLPTFSGEFLLDDHPLVSENPYIKQSRSFWSYFSQEDGVSPHGKMSEYHTGYYRPLINITYFINYKLWGMRPAAFRAVNLAFHLMTSMLLFLVVAKYYQGIVPLVTALFFGLHPVNTGAVSWVAARNNILVSLFSLASFYFYAFRKPEKETLYMAISLLFYTVALFCKEFALMLLPIFIVYDIIVRGETFRDRRRWLGYVPYAVVLALYLLMRWLVTESVLSPGEGTSSGFQRLYFVPYLVLYDLRLIFLPYGLHSFIVSYPKTFLSWEAAVGFGGLSLLGLLLRRYRREKMIVFPFCAFMIGLFPVLNIVSTSAVSVVSMRWLYFPLVFFMLFFGWALDRILRWKKTTSMLIISPFLAYLGMHSYFLNLSQWHDEWSLFHREVMGFKNFFYAGGLAEKYHDRNDYKNAEKYYRLTVLHFPDNVTDQINYAALLVELKKPREALAQLERVRAVKMTPEERGRLYNNQGMAYLQLGRLDEAVCSFEHAVQLAPSDAMFWANLGGAYGNMGRYEDSVSALRKGLEIDPNSTELRKNLAVTYMRMEANEEALSVLEGIPASERMKSIDAETLLRNLREKVRSY